MNVTRLTLYRSDIQHEDSGNYTCEVNGPHNALLGAVTHYIYVRGAHTHTHSLSLSLSLSLSPVYVGTALSHTSSFKCYLCVLGRRDQRRTLYLGATLPESRYCNKSMMMMMMTTRWQRPRQQP